MKYRQIIKNKFVKHRYEEKNMLPLRLTFKLALPNTHSDSGRDPQGGVFTQLVDRAAFSDRVKISVEGIVRERPLPAVWIKTNDAAGGPGGKWARCITGFCLRTGNHFTALYSKYRLYKNLPAIMLTLFSDHCPVTLAEVVEVESAVLRAGFNHRVSFVEVTADVSGTNVPDLASQYAGRAMTVNALRDPKGFKTAYFGSKNSPLQLRIYDKYDGIVRVEFMLRLGFLRAHEINQQTEIAKLGALGPDDVGGFWERDMKRLERDLAGIPRTWLREELLNRGDARPFITWAWQMRNAGFDPRSYLRPSAMEMRLRKMRRGFIW